jgi:hypothetical protein
MKSAFSALKYGVVHPKLFTFGYKGNPAAKQILGNQNEDQALLELTILVGNM